MSTQEVIHHQHNILELREFSEVENDVTPLILYRDPKIYLHSVCFFLVPRAHPHYTSLRKLIELWLDKIPYGQSSVTIDATSRYVFEDDLEKRRWYTVDMREDPDTWSNGIVLKNFETVPEFVRHQFAHDMLKSVKSLVIFADSIQQIPKVWRSLSVWALTAKQTPFHLREICMSGTAHTPMDIETFRRHQDDQLLGFSKFNEMPAFVYWPAW